MTHQSSGTFLLSEFTINNSAGTRWHEKRGWRPTDVELLHPSNLIFSCCRSSQGRRRGGKNQTKIEWLKKRREREKCWATSSAAGTFPTHTTQLVLYNSPKYINEIKTMPNISLPLRKNKPNSDALCFLLPPQHVDKRRALCERDKENSGQASHSWLLSFPFSGGCKRERERENGIVCSTTVLCLKRLLLRVVGGSLHLDTSSEACSSTTETNSTYRLY